MTIFSSPRFLRTVLWADAASCIGSGALQLVALDALPTLLGLPLALLVQTGLFLVGYGLVVAWMASQSEPPRRLVALCAVGNLGWAAGCVVAVVAFQPTAPGIAWIAMQAACVVVLAQLQYLGLRGSRVLPRMAAA